MRLATGLAFAVLFATVLLACTPRPAHMPLGDSVKPPIGAQGFCERNPEDEKCPKKPS